MNSDLGRELAVVTPAERPSGRILEGRLYDLRPLDPGADARALFPLSHGSPEREAVWSYLPDGPFASIEDLARMLTGLKSDPTNIPYAVVDRATGAVAGMGQLMSIVPSQRRLEIGYLMYPPGSQRTKANTEAAYLMMREAFELGYRRVEWKCNDLNAPSKRAALRLGFQYEGLFRQHMILKGRNRDTAWFSVIDGDWPRVKRTLERWLYETPLDDQGRPTESLAELMKLGLHARAVP